MGLNGMGLGLLFTATDLASGVISRISSALGRLGGTAVRQSTAMQTAFGAIGPALASVSLGLGTLSGAMDLSDQYAEFEYQLAAAGAVAGATEEQLGRMGEAALEAGLRTQFSPVESVEGLQTLATAGLNAEASIRTLLPVLDLAAGSMGQLAVPEAADAVIGTMNSYQMGAADATAVTDKLLRITQRSAFQAKDFAGGLAKSAAVGAIFKQSLDDVLISLGFLRQRNIDASSSSTAFREAVRRLGADQRVQRAVTARGVQIFDQATGSMRPVVDITLELADALSSATDEERQSLVTLAYGARGLAFFNAVAQAQVEVLREGELVTLQGAEALAYMREEMKNSAGAAEEFRAALAGTLKGQWTLFAGVMQTWGILLGEPFALILKPIVTSVVAVTTELAGVLQNLPRPIKIAFAALTLFAGGFLAAGGGTALLVAGVVLLLPLIKLAAIGFAAGVAALLPLVATIALVVPALIALHHAFERNIGGLGDFVASALARGQAAFRALQDLFTHGGFTEAVYAELQKAENRGIRQFAVNVYVYAHRIAAAWNGMVEGFSFAMDQAGPVFERFVGALRSLGLVFDDLFILADPGANELEWERWAATGERVGASLGEAALRAVDALTTLLLITGAVARGIEGLGQKFDGVEPAFDRLGASVRDLWDALTGSSDASRQSQKSMANLTYAVDVAVGAFVFLGGVVTGFYAAQISAVAGAVMVIRTWLFRGAQAVVGLVDVVAGLLTGDWQRVWLGAKTTAVAAGRSIIDTAFAIAEAVASVVDSLGAMLGLDFGLSDRLGMDLDELSRKLDAFDRTLVGARADSIFGADGASSRIESDWVPSTVESPSPESLMSVPPPAPITWTDGGEEAWTSVGNHLADRFDAHAPMVQSMPELPSIAPSATSDRREFESLDRARAEVESVSSVQNGQDTARAVGDAVREAVRTGRGPAELVLRVEVLVNETVLGEVVERIAMQRGFSSFEAASQ